MTTIQQNLICLLIVLLSIIFVGWLAQKPLFEPQGLISLNQPSKSSKHYSMQEVGVYDHVPFSGKVRGDVTAELALISDESEYDQVQRLVDYARVRAGAIGANGLVVEMVAQRGQVLYLAGKLVEY